MRINGNNEVNLNNTQRPVQQQEIQHDNTFQREGDFESAFRAAGILGQSMVKPYSGMSKNEKIAHQIFENAKKKIPNETVDKILKDYGLDDNKIAEYRKTIKKDEVLNRIVYQSHILGENTLDLETQLSLLLSVDDVDTISELFTRKFLIVNDENIKLLSEHMNTDIEHAKKTLISLTDKTAVSPESLAQYLDISETLKIPIEDVGYMLSITEKPELYTKERLTAYKNLCDTMRIEPNWENCESIDDPAAITPEFLQKHKETVQKVQQQNISTIYDKDDSNFCQNLAFISKEMHNPIAAFDRYNRIINKMEEYNIDFTWYKSPNNKTIPLEKVENILFNDNLPQGYLNKSAELLDSLDSNTKAKFRNVVLKSMTCPPCLENIDDYSGLLNTLSKIPNCNLDMLNLTEYIQKKRL